MVNDIKKGSVVDTAVAEGGAYEIIRERLIQQGNTLENKTKELNTARAKEFGSTEMAVEARTRVRTENNCVGRDIVQVGDLLLFGYNVFIGLKKTTKVEDVFSLFRLVSEGDKHSMEAIPSEGSFLADPKFHAEFDELYNFYKEARLVQLSHRNGKLLAGFQIGDRLDDRRVFRWAVSEDGKTVTYIDNRGERDIELPQPHDFEWIMTEREHIVHGRHPHINILDQVFIETIGGDLTIKVENNTEDGMGIFRESVDDETQSLDDAEIYYAQVGGLILIKVKPYKEEQWRGLIYNTLSKTVVRIDEIVNSCVQLPEDHGVIFSGGYYLENSEYKTFDTDIDGLVFKRKIRSPNGEDVLYVFYEPVSGMVALLAYNLITKNLQNPILSHGYALASNGQIIVFTADDEPARIHPMQVWKSPFVSDEYASKKPVTQSFFSRIGNPDLVTGISDLFSVCRAIRDETVSVRHYEALHRTANKLFDNHFWITDSETKGIGDSVKEISATVDLVVDEFEKVESIRKQSAKIMQEAKDDQQKIIISSDSATWKSVDEYVNALDAIRKQRGHLTTIKKYRYIDIPQIENMDTQLVELNAKVSEQTAEFLSSESALDSYITDISNLEDAISKHQTVAAIDPDLQKLEDIANGLDLLSELIGTLKVDDATVRTAIVESISDVYAKLNQTRARGRQRRESLGSAETVEQFSAQFKLFSQSITNALGLSTTPEKCEEQLARLLVQLEEMESQFGEHEKFLNEILTQREEIYNAFETQKQTLLDKQNTRAQMLSDTLKRMLDNIEKRTQRFETDDELNTYLASDPMVLKVRDIVEQLRDLGNAVKADDAEGRLKMIQDQALRVLRDRSDLYLEGGRVIKMGPRHQFSVSTEELDLSIIPRNDGLALHLVGTQYFEAIENEELNAQKAYWNLSLESETPEVYRAEYLAYLIIQAARYNQEGLSWAELLKNIKDEEHLNNLVQNFAKPRYKDAYQKGVHDADAASLLGVLVPAIERGGLLRFNPESRALAQIIWANIQPTTKSKTSKSALNTIETRASSASRLSELYQDRSALDLIEKELLVIVNEFLAQHPITVDDQTISTAVSYLAAELSRDKTEFVSSKESTALLTQFKKSIEASVLKEFNTTLNNLSEHPDQQWDLANAWLYAQVENSGQMALLHYIPEAAAAIITDKALTRRKLNVDVNLKVENLFGEHLLIDNGSLSFSLDTFLSRLDDHCTRVIPGYKKYLQIRHDIAETTREELRLEEFKPKPLSSFVRNRLINESYLPIIGDNLAKQIGTVGDTKRSDLNGLLMMISPPGYGKTTLMEYVASRLGLTFMKINCPVLGHDVTSIDPAGTTDATAKQELEKLNLALQMGDNVMLYLDDIQHTNSEFLQKFISLCDSTRRIEGVWKGKTKTYDLRGRKFCVVMAGNPYTESGEMFRVPDMLANRADIYNLGDVLSGKDEQFSLSYIENCLTSNSVLAPLATREMSDVYKFIDLAKGREVATTDLSHEYSSAEVNEITKVFERLFVIQDTILKVNQQYIASAAQADNYRTEPPFLLQGSYRNMNKLAEKISAVMNDEELDNLITDHYRGEAQLLTQGTEANLLKLAELRGTLDQESKARWEQICKDFQRIKKMGGDDADSGQKIANQIAELVDSVDNQKTNVSITNKTSKEFSEILKMLNETLENTLFPLVRSMDTRISQDVDAHKVLEQLKTDMESLKDRDKKIIRQLLKERFDEE